MQAKKSAKSPITSPKRAASRAGEVRARLKGLGINERDVAKAVFWVRKAK